MISFFAYTLFIVVTSVAETPQPVDVAKIMCNVSVLLENDFAVAFDRDGDRLMNPSKSKKAEVKILSIHVKLDRTNSSPIPPLREGATRPFLSIKNNFERTLHCRVLTRLKGSKEFVAMTEHMSRIPAGEVFYKCWEFDFPVDEVMLYEFKLSDEP